MDYTFILNANNEPVASETIAAFRWREKNWRRCIVARTRIQDVPVVIEVSTVFLVTDHNWARFIGIGPDIEPRPILFETMVFGGEHAEEQERYCTWEEAERGHAELVARIFAIKTKRTKEAT